MYKVTDVAGLLEIMKSLQGEKTQRDFASEIGVSPQYLNDFFNSRRDPGPAIYSYLGAERCFRVPQSTVTAALSAKEQLNAKGISAQVEKGNTEIQNKSANRKRIRKNSD